MEQEKSGFRLKGALSGIPPMVKWLIYLSSFGAVSYGYLVILISAYLPEPEVGLTSADVGLLLGVMGIAFVVCAIPVGMLADRKGRKWILIAGMAGTAPPIFVFALTQDMAYLILASVAMGATESAFMASWNALIADLTSKETRNSAFALSFVVGTAAFGLGFALPLAFPWIESTFGWDSYSVHMNTLIVVGFLTLLSPFTYMFLLRDLKEELRPNQKFIRGKNLRVLLKFSGINSTIGLGAGFIIPLIPTWLFLKFGVPDTFSGPLLAVSSITMGFAAIMSTGLARKYGMIRAIVLTQGMSTVFMLSLAFVPDAALASGLYLVRAALMNMAVPLLDSFLMGIVSKEERGLASAVNAIVWRLPNSASTVAGGYILEGGDFVSPFYIATILYAIGVTLFYRTFKDVTPTT
jgi:MFS family permease